MIYTKPTNKAMKVAYYAHEGQLAKAGLPHVFHPYHLAEQMDDETSVCVALLHDVVEDTDVTFEDLEKEFPQEVVSALRLLTHDPEIDYFDYVRSIRQNPTATRVSLPILSTTRIRADYLDARVWTKGKPRNAEESTRGRRSSFQEAENHSPKIRPKLRFLTIRQRAPLSSTCIKHRKPIIVDNPCELSHGQLAPLLVASR